MLSATTTVFGSAMLYRRAARLGVSPTMPVPSTHPAETADLRCQSRGPFWQAGLHLCCGGGYLSLPGR